jgi:hypothetical protein
VAQRVAASIEHNADWAERRRLAEQQRRDRYKKWAKKQRETGVDNGASSDTQSAVNPATV